MSKGKIAFYILIVIVFIVLGYIIRGGFGAVFAAVGSIFALSRRHDGRGNNSGIDEQLGKARDLDKREGSAIERERTDIDRERIDIGTEKTIVNRDRELLEELQKRHPRK